MHYDQPTQPVQYVYEPAPPPKRGCLRSCFSRMVFLLLFGVTALVFAGVGIAGIYIYNTLSRDIEDGIAKLEAARTRETFATTRIVDRNGDLLWEFFGEGKRTAIPYAQMPQSLIDATVAVEDDTFFVNDGYDLPALIAALIANFRNPDARPVGGSTITQQIVRHIVFDYEERVAVSYNRKAKELILSYIMSQQFTKEEILEMYLNEIYYGNLAYGVEAAAQTYFGKSATDLTLAEATLLAGLPQSPVELDPITNLEGAKQRQWIVLNLMSGDGIITQTEAEAIYLETLNFATQEVSLTAPHFAIYVRQQLEEMYGAEVVANGGLLVTTTLDLKYQRLAELMATQHVTGLAESNNLTNASLVAMKPGTGEILAMLGSVDYHNDDIEGRVNVALSLQQPGSAIKPLTYALAMSPTITGGDPAWTAADLLWDVPVSYPQFDGSTYDPVNYDGQFHGPVRLREALANSYNIPAVLLLQDVGVPAFLNFAQHMGLTTFSDDPSNYGLSLTLGGAEVTPLDLTTAYGVFANGGYYVAPTSILRVEKSNGELLYEIATPDPQPVLDPRIAFMISDMLDDDAAREPAMGRDNPLNLPFPAAAKTGTTNDFRDNWTMGYTPGLVVGVWAGNTDNSEMINVSGLTGAAPLWSDFMDTVYATPDMVATLGNNGAQPPTEFVPPAGLEQRRLCALSSVTGWANECQWQGSEWFLQADPNAPIPTATPPVPLEQRQVVWEKLEPGVWRMPAFYVTPDLQITSTENPDLPTQQFCYFLQGQRMVDLPQNTFQQLFLQPPRNPESIQPAYQWASARNMMILPPTPCQQSALVAITPTPNLDVWQPTATPNWQATASANNNGGQVPATPVPNNVPFRITNPQPNQKVSGLVQIYGTANFNTAEVQYYKIEIDLGQNQWVTLGETHSQPVVNGVLESLHADALNAGIYKIRLIGVRWDGNYVTQPFTIPIEIVRN